MSNLKMKSFSSILFFLVVLTHWVNTNPVNLALAKALLGAQLDSPLLTNLGPISHGATDLQTALASTFAMSAEELLPLFLLLSQQKAKNAAAAGASFPSQASATQPTDTTSVLFPELG